MPSFSGPPPSHSRRAVRSRRARIFPVVLAIVQVGVVALVGILWIQQRHGPSSGNAASTTTTGAKSSGNQPMGAPAAPVPPACSDDALMALPLRAKLAQLLMVGVSGVQDAQAVVDNYHVGGIFIGSWTDLSMLANGTTDRLQRSGTPLPVAVSTDEEGGRVSRLSSLIGPSPSARDLAAASTPDQVYQVALERGHKMRGLGITVDFAPVADVSDQPADSVIGDRSFSNDPEKVTEYAGAYARGLRDAGLLPVLKHFPGHGHGSGDTHTGAVTTPPLAQMQTSDLVPYRTLVAQPPVAVMVGHMQVPDLTGTQPASLSPAAYGLLRSGAYGAAPFGGPIFTDDLGGMRAITDNFGVPQAALASLQAGADVALWTTTDEVPAVLDRLEAAVNAGELNAADVDAKVRQVAAMKGRSPQCGG
jgi:beta-N-acetylhexosaminidase